MGMATRARAAIILIIGATWKTEIGWEKVCGVRAVTF